MTPVIALAWVLGFVMACVLGFAQYKYALSGYPQTRKWQVVLALTGFLAGIPGGWIATIGIEEVQPLPAGLVMGIFLGYASLKWMPQRSKTFMLPPRD